MFDRSPAPHLAASDGFAADELAAPGRLIELSGRGAAARTSTAVGLVRDAQLAGESTAWIQARGGPLFPPDLAAAGVDLDALVVAHVPAEDGAAELARAAEILLRSGAFGLVVADLSGLRAPRGAAWQARLAALARRHQSRLVLLSDASPREGSLGPLIGLRIAARRGAGSGPFAVALDVLKNKSGRTGESRRLIHRHPAAPRS